VSSLNGLCIDASLDVSCDAHTLQVTAQGQQILVRVASLWSAIRLLRTMRRSGMTGETLRRLARGLLRCDLTLSVRTPKRTLLSLGRHCRSRTIGLLGFQHMQLGRVAANIKQPAAR
jgi:hypothetical protein